MAIVSDDYRFRLGDQFRIILESNADVHACVIYQSDQGSATVLFPDARCNQGRNVLPAHTQCVLPPAGWFGFGDSPGAEQIFVIVSRKPIDKLNVPPTIQRLGPNWWLALLADFSLEREDSIKAKQTREFMYRDQGPAHCRAPRHSQPFRGPGCTGPEAAPAREGLYRPRRQPRRCAPQEAERGIG